MNIAFQKHFFKETLVLLVLLCLLPTFSMAANDFYIKEADMVVSTEKDWICLAKDTQNVDLEGTPFNYVGMDALVQQQITNLNSSQYEMIKAVLLYMNDDYQMIEAQLMVDQSEESKETWDISLYPNAESQVDETVTETYITKNNEKFFAISEEDSNGEVLIYLTINNGRMIVFAIRGYDLIQGTNMKATSTLPLAHNLLDRVQFTKKSPNPNSSLTLTQDKNDNGFLNNVWSFFSKLWQKMWYFFSEAAFFQSKGLLFWAVFWIPIYAVYAIVKAIIKKVKKK